MPIDSDPHPSSHELADLIGLRRSLIRLQDETRLLRRHLLRRKYGPAQPRVPAGNTGGGRWTSGESGGGPRAGFGSGLGDGQGESGEAGPDGATVYDTSGDEAWASYARVSATTARCSSATSPTATAAQSTRNTPPRAVRASTSARPSR